MTPEQLKAYIATQLAVPVNQVQKLIDALYAMVDFTATQNTDTIPDWTALLTFNTDGSGAGKYCKYADTNGNKRIFETKTDGNINNPPPTDPLVSENANWEEISASAGSAIQEWAPGLYGTGLVIVYHNHSTDGRGLYILLDPVRPFTSSNIETEIAAGKWILLSKNYIDNSITTAINNLKEGVPTDGDTLNKLYNLIQFLINRSPQSFDASGGAFPTTYGGNAIQAGDPFRITVAGTLGSTNQKTVNAEDLLIALVDAPGNNGNDWQIVESNRDQATDSVKGVAKLFNSLGSNTDGPIDQKTSFEYLQGSIIHNFNNFK
jgi:hypothetical protein